MSVGDDVDEENESFANDESMLSGEEYEEISGGAGDHVSGEAGDDVDGDDGDDVDDGEDNNDDIAATWDKEEENDAKKKQRRVASSAAVATTRGEEKSQGVTDDEDETDVDATDNDRVGTKLLRDNLEKHSRSKGVRIVKGTGERLSARRETFATFESRCGCEGEGPCQCLNESVDVLAGPGRLVSLAGAVKGE
jgi:hypothetical protein